jgi:hypothetical protein
LVIPITGSGGGISSYISELATVEPVSCEFEEREEFSAERKEVEMTIYEVFYFHHQRPFWKLFETLIHIYERKKKTTHIKTTNRYHPKTTIV